MIVTPIVVNTAPGVRDTAADKPGRWLSPGFPIFVIPQPGSITKIIPKAAAVISRFIIQNFP